MEQCPVTFSNMGQLHGFVCDPKMMHFENSSKAFTRAEVICPRPYHASRIPMFMEGVNKFCPKSKSILPKQKEDSSFEFRDIILNKDAQYCDLDGGAQMVFFCGSPPLIPLEWESLVQGLIEPPQFVAPSVETQKSELRVLLARNLNPALLFLPLLNITLTINFLAICIKFPVLGENQVAAPLSFYKEKCSLLMILPYLRVYKGFAFW